MSTLARQLKPATAVLTLLLTLPLWGSPVLAQEGEEAEPSPKATAIEEAWAKRPGAMSAEQIAEVDAEHAARRNLQENRVRERINRYLAAASKAIDEDGAEKAGALLDRLNVDRMNDVEKARVFVFRGFVAYQEGNPEKTIEYFRKAIAQEVLPVKDETRLRFNIAQLYAGEQDWKKTIDAIDAWIPWALEPDPLAYYLKAIAYFQMDKLDEALQDAEAAVDLSEEPKEGWLQLLAALYIQKEDYDSAAPVLEELVLNYPKKAYWVQLSLVYGALEKYPRSLAVQQVAYDQGLLDQDKELRRLARSYLFANMPYQGAKVLEKGIEDGIIEGDSEAYEMLANSWIAAREYEKSLSPLEEAAALSDDGNLYVRLGQVYLQRENWDKAIDALDKAVAKDSLRNPGTALLLLGISSYNVGKKADARRYFVRARGHEKTKTSAQGWITYIDNEVRPDESAAPKALKSVVDAANSG